MMIAASTLTAVVIPMIVKKGLTKVSPCGIIIIEKEKRGVHYEN